MRLVLIQVYLFCVCDQRETVMVSLQWLLLAKQARGNDKGYSPKALTVDVGNLLAQRVVLEPVSRSLLQRTLWLLAK